MPHKTSYDSSSCLRAYLVGLLLRGPSKNGSSYKTFSRALSEEEEPELLRLWYDSLLPSFIDNQLCGGIIMCMWVMEELEIKLLGSGDKNKVHVFQQKKD
jgi:hypothetical protein